MSRPELKPMEIDCRTVKAKLESGDDFVLLDCRERDEYDTVKIADARLFPMSEAESRVSELLQYGGKEVIVYCHHGMRSLQMAAWLRGQGISSAKSMTGGIDRWALEIDTALPRY